MIFYFGFQSKCVDQCVDNLNVWILNNCFLVNFSVIFLSYIENTKRDVLNLTIILHFKCKFFMFTVLDSKIHHNNMLSTIFNIPHFLCLGTNSNVWKQRF